MRAIGAPSFDCEFDVVALKAFTQALLQRVLQQSRFADAVEAEYFGAARAFEMPMLMVRSLASVLLRNGRLRMLRPGAVAEYPVVSGDFVCQSGIGEAIKRTIQSDAIHVRQRILKILMRKSAPGAKQRRQHFHSGRSNTYRCLLQLRLGERQQGLGRS